MSVNKRSNINNTTVHATRSSRLIKQTIGTMTLSPRGSALVDSSAPQWRNRHTGGIPQHHSISLWRITLSSPIMQCWDFFLTNNVFFFPPVSCVTALRSWHGQKAYCDQRNCQWNPLFSLRLSHLQYSCCFYFRHDWEYFHDKYTKLINYLQAFFVISL